MTAATDIRPTAAMLARSWATASWAYDDDGADYVAPADDRPQIRCGHCGATHHAIEIVKACHDGAEIHQCDYLVEIQTEDGPTAVDCGEDAAVTDHGMWCTAGHSYVDMVTREREGWDYADDAYDAAVILAGGREFRPGGVNTSIDPREVAHIMSHLVR